MKKQEGIISPENIKLISDFKNWLYGEFDLSECTIKGYTDSMNLFFRKYESANKQNYKRFLSEMDLNGLKPQTCNVRINAFNKFSEFIGDNGLKLKTIKLERTLFLENIPSEKHYQKLVEYLSKHKNKEYLFWVRVLGCTGARIGEFLQFTWEGLSKGEFIVKGKGNKCRTFFVPKQLSSEISEYAKLNNKKGRFALNRYGSPVTSRGVSQQLVYWGEQLGFPKGMIHPHAFRHFFAKQYLKTSKNDIVQLAQILGHGSLDITRIYTMKSKKEQKKDFNKFVNW